MIQLKKTKKYVHFKTNSTTTNKIGNTKCFFSKKNCTENYNNYGDLMSNIFTNWAKSSNSGNFYLNFPCNSTTTKNWMFKIDFSFHSTIDLFSVLYVATVNGVGNNIISMHTHCALCSLAHFKLCCDLKWTSVETLTANTLLRIATVLYFNDLCRWWVFLLLLFCFIFLLLLLLFLQIHNTIIYTARLSMKSIEVKTIYIKMI